MHCLNLIVCKNNLLELKKELVWKVYISNFKQFKRHIYLFNKTVSGFWFINFT